MIETPYNFEHSDEEENEECDKMPDFLQKMVQKDQMMTDESISKNDELLFNPYEDSQN